MVMLKSALALPTEFSAEMVIWPEYSLLAPLMLSVLEFSPLSIVMPLEALSTLPSCFHSTVGVGTPVTVVKMSRVEPAFCVMFANLSS